MDISTPIPLIAPLIVPRGAPLGARTGARVPGKVYLVGAGPGDPELLTLKAVRAIASADVVLIDDLADKRVLVHASAQAKVIHVGKRGGCKSTPQAFIERLMARYARAGKVVARIKGGDPFVFGRGGEEMLSLRAAGVQVEVMSGITAGIGVPASIGIPVTHRGAAPGVVFVTGHTRDGGGADGASAPNWAALAKTGLTLVIYMGVTNLPAIARALIDGGLAATTPACAIQSGTVETQQQVIATLGTLATAMQEARIASPAMIVIGKVVSLSFLQSHVVNSSEVTHAIAA